MSDAASIVLLESYATVVAALGAGLSLPHALELAEVAPAEWEPASQHWQSRIEESAASDLVVLVAFDAALIAAKRRFEPTVDPIESDARAWAHFRRHFLSAVQPVEFLARHDLTLSTYARIEAEWTNRVLSDEALSGALQKHMQEPLEPCPKVTLVASPWLLQHQAAAPTQAHEPPQPERDCKPAARAHDETRDPRSIEAPRLSVAQQGEPTEAPAWMPKGMRGFTLVDDTQPAPEAPAGPALPFAPPVPQPAPPSAVAAPFPPGMRGFAKVHDLPFTPPVDSAPQLAPPPVASPVQTTETPRLTLEQYAWCCVELALYPAYTRDILHRYGLDEEQHQTLDMFWRSRLILDGGLRTAWEDFCSAYRHQLLSSHGSK